MYYITKFHLHLKEIELQQNEILGCRLFALTITKKANHVLILIIISNTLVVIFAH